MADVFEKAKRSAIMAAVKTKDTSPELVVRRLLHRSGFRYRLHCSDLPGRPDIVLPRFRTVIFVHGCFWHSHPGCRRAKRPETRREFWDAKLDLNLARDTRNEIALRDLGWRVITVWQCETRDKESLRDRLVRELMVS